MTDRLSGRDSGYLQKEPLFDPVVRSAQRIATGLKYGIVALAYVSELKHLGAPMPIWMSSYSVDLALPIVGGILIDHFATSPFLRPAPIRYALAASICIATEVAQKYFPITGNFDVNDITTMVAGAAIGLVIEKTSELHTFYRTGLLNPEKLLER